MTDKKETMNLDQAAKMLGISRSLAYKAARDGVFPTPVIRIGRRVLIPTWAVKSLLRYGNLLEGRGDDDE